MNPCVDVPPAVIAALGKTGLVPVAGTLNDVPVRTMLVPIGGGRYRLFINEKMRADAKVKVGDLIELILEIDTDSREQLLPPALEAAFEVHSRAKARFDTFPHSHKRQILNYLNSLKTPEALQLDIKKLLVKLEEV